MAYKDPANQRAAARRWYEKNKHVYIERNRTRTSEKRAYVQQKKDVPCADCGGRYPYYVMDFHHEDRDAKTHNVSSLITYGWERLKKEIEMCCVLCANCHRIREHP